MEERKLIPLTKTDKILRALIGVCQSSEDRISEEELWSLLDCPSRAQKYKLISELLIEKEYRPAILIKYVSEDKLSYGLNPCFQELILKN